MKKLTIAITFAVSACFISVHAAPADSITVAGRIRNMAEGMPRTIIINECDISDKSAKEVCGLDENGSFCQKIPFSFPHTFTLNYNKRNFINAFAAPGDSVYLDIDVSCSPLSVSFSGDNAEISRQYDKAFQDLSPMYWSVRLPSDNVALDEYLSVFKKYVKEGRDSIDSYARHHNLSDNVVSMLYADNTYCLANMAISYKGRNKKEKRAFFLDPVFDIFNEDNTRVMLFPYHLAALMYDFPDVRDNTPKGIIRDLMYACDEKTPAPDRSVFFNQKYYDRLYTQNKEVKNISIENIKPGSIVVFTDSEIKEVSNENPLAWLIKECKDHPVYLDVSATWCGPCRAGLKGSESLRKHFKESNIRFAVIWLRSSKEEWLKVAPTISNAIQLFIDNAEMTDLITKYLTIKGFPSYFMIDKKGSITKNGVPDYLSTELPVFLDGYK